MIKVGSAQVSSVAEPAAFFARWADMPGWSEWNADTEWARLDGPFVVGATGQLKPKGGPKVRFVIERLVPDREFVDVSLLFGARLTFDHQVRTTPTGGCVIDVTITLTGPLSRLWNLILGKGLRDSAQPDLDRLVALVEQTQDERPLVIRRGPS
jgi:hypothetical protein